MSQSRVLLQNLGGSGGLLPFGTVSNTSRGPPEQSIRLSNVTFDSYERPVDMIITNTTPYTGSNPLLNGFTSSRRRLAGVNLRAPVPDYTTSETLALSSTSATFVEIRVTFVNALTSEPVVLSSTHVSFVDLDIGNQSSVRADCAGLRPRLMRIHPACKREAMRAST